MLDEYQELNQIINSSIVSYENILEDRNPSKKKKTIDNDVVEVEDIKEEPVNMCGVLNSRGKPCQRMGYCPFHSKTTKKSTTSRSSKRRQSIIQRQQETEIEYEEEGEDYGNYDNDDEEEIYDSQYKKSKRKKKSKSYITTKKDRVAVVPISILLIAAAAIERQSLNLNSDVINKTPLSNKKETLSEILKKSRLKNKY